MIPLLTSGSAFYGLGMGSPRIIGKLWNSKPESDDRSIYWTLRRNGIENITTVGISSLCGSILLIFIINYIPRKQFLVYSFLWLAALFFVTGGSIFSVYHTEMHAVSIVLIALCHFSFNLGQSYPAALTYNGR